MARAERLPKVRVRGLLSTSRGERLRVPYVA